MRTADGAQAPSAINPNAFIARRRFDANWRTPINGRLCEAVVGRYVFASACGA